MSLGMDVDPAALPRDWRSVVRSGAFVILLGLGVVLIAGAVSVPIADARVSPLEDQVAAHLAEMKATRPQMQAYVDEERAARKEINAKLELLVEDCYRRGGCKR